jgi:hypothetical protein
MRANGGPLNEPHRTPNDHLHARDRLTLLDPGGQASWSATSCAWRCSPILILRPNEKSRRRVEIGDGFFKPGHAFKHKFRYLAFVVFEPLV